MEPASVTKLDIPPKQIKEKYRDVDITVTFIISTQTWHYRLSYTAPVALDGFGTTLERALKEARDVIDKMRDH